MVTEAKGSCAWLQGPRAGPPGWAIALGPCSYWRSMQLLGNDPDMPIGQGVGGSGSASARSKKIVTQSPSPSFEATSIRAFAFCTRDFAISAAILPGLGHSTPGPKPTPSSATWTWQPDEPTTHRSVIVPPSRPLNACFNAFVSNSLTSKPAGMATLRETGHVST